MKKADPNMVRRRIDLKTDLTKEQKAKRKSAAEKLWRLFQGVSGFTVSGVEGTMRSKGT
jgi:hypothetical protein